MPVYSDLSLHERVSCDHFEYGRDKVGESHRFTDFAERSAEPFSERSEGRRQTQSAVVENYGVRVVDTTGCQGGRRQLGKGPDETHPRLDKAHCAA
jgi:hypothetical protein